VLELRNQTPFAAAIVPGLDKSGHDTVTIVVKGTFSVRSRAGLALADTQLPIHYSEIFHGEPGISSIKYEADACPQKRGTDVVLIGHARSPKPVAAVDVEVRAGNLFQRARVSGDRVWFKTVGGPKASDAALFTRMPLTYERAFGGGDAAALDPAKRPRDPRNPVGVGYCSKPDSDAIEGVRLPNIEDPTQLVTSPVDRPPVVGFGFLGRDWLPRATFAGTYDETWQKERFPFLPLDFDERFFHAAPPGMTSSRPLRGGEPVQVLNASETGELNFSVPTRRPRVDISIRREELTLTPQLDTLLIDGDESRVVLTWRATTTCSRKFLYIDWVRVKEEAS
jgi:hypothetical protein